MTRLLIRDAHAQIHNDKTEYEMPSGGLDIIAEDGRTLFSIRIVNGGMLEIDGGDVCKHEGALRDRRFTIRPDAANRVTLIKQDY